MTSITLFDELCRITSTLESLTQSKVDPVMTIALKSIVQDLDSLIDTSVESGVLTVECATTSGEEARYAHR